MSTTNGWTDRQADRQTMNECVSDLMCELLHMTMANVVTAQPGGKEQMQWMPAPASVTGCPPGLEYLAQLDQLIVMQQVSLLEVLTAWEVRNKFIVSNSMGQQVYTATEESDMCMRQCCGPSRGFMMHITDNNGQEIIRAEREFKCCAGCCWCANGHCGWEMRVEAPVGTVIGFIRQRQSKWKMHLAVYDDQDNHLFTTWAPCCPCQGICCTDDINFPFTDKGGRQVVANMAKQWAGLQELVTDADRFSLTFPPSLDVKQKAILFASVFMVDMMLFEKKEKKNRR
ncbi:hypothetical protein ScPMuIL_000209 [Solemya velum]